MKRLMRMTFGCLLLLIECGFCLGQNAAGPVEVTLCELYQHPEDYAGKIIKVRGGSVSGLGIEDLMHDSQQVPCLTYMSIVVVFPEQVKPAPGFQLVRDESFKKLEDALNYNGPIHIDATYEGRFDAGFAWRDKKRIRAGDYTGKGYGKKHFYDGRIVLIRVSNVWAMPIPHR
jgi:hypothetical protein